MMFRKLMMAVAMACAVASGSSLAQDPNMRAVVTCSDLNWSAQVLAANPDIEQSCRGVYEKDGRLYAEAEVEVVRVRGSTITFRPLHVDGSKGESRKITVAPAWRATIDGREYRASELERGQQLQVYLPEDRFALALQDDDGPTETEIIIIEDALVSMPATASPLFAIGLSGAVLLLIAGALRGARRRQG